MCCKPLTTLSPDQWLLNHQGSVLAPYGSPPTANRWPHWERDTPLQRCSRRILQPQPTGRLLIRSESFSDLITLDWFSKSLAAYCQFQISLQNISHNLRDVLLYSYGPPHMAEQKQDDQLEHIYSSYVRIRDVALKTCQRRWTIRRNGERGSGISVLAARHDDDDDDDDQSVTSVGLSP